MDIRRRRGAWLLTCVALATAQPYDELLQTLMQAEPTTRFANFCTRWSNAQWTQNITDTNKIGTLKTCDGLYERASQDAAPVLLHLRPATGPNRPPGLFSTVDAAATSTDTRQTVVSVCSQVAASVKQGAPEIGQCPESHPFVSGSACCSTLQEVQQGNLARCVKCTMESCTEPRHCPSGIVDGDLTISTVLDQWYPVQFNDVVLAAQRYNPQAGFSAANTKVALVPNLNLGTGTRAFYASMSDPERLRRLCFSETPSFGPALQPPLPPPWVLALTFVGEMVPGQIVQRAVGPPVTMVHDGAEVVGPDGHVVITSPAVAFSWVLGASAALRNSDNVQCAPSTGDSDAAQQQALDADAARLDAATVHTWKIFDATSVRVGLPFASAASCFDVNARTNVPTLSDMQMLCDASAPDCVAVALRPDKACLIAATQTADGVSLPYVHDPAIDYPPEAVFTTYAAREPVSKDLAHMVGVAPLGSESAAVHPRHTVDSCRALCWADSGCTAWTLDGADCRLLGASQTQPVITTDGLNLTCMETLGFDVGPRSAQCSGLPLDYAFSIKHQKCVHANDYLLQPWCPEPWTTASGSQAVPRLSTSGAAFVSYPRATCVCGTDEHVVGTSSPDGRTGVRCTGTGAAIRHPGTYSQREYKAVRVFLRTDVTVLETFTCAVAETCPNEAVARCKTVEHCAGAIWHGATSTVEIVAGQVDTEDTLNNPAGKTAEQRQRDSARMQTLPLPHAAPDQVFMYASPSQTVQEGVVCHVEWMQFVDPPLVCVRSAWVKQTAENVDNVRHGAVVCGDETLSQGADRARYECVDRPLVRTTPAMGDSLLAGNVNPLFTGAVPVAHGSDAAALYVARVEQCVNPAYTLNLGPVVQPSTCTNTVAITGAESWRAVQAEHPTMVREVFQRSGCLETDGVVPSDVRDTMADLFSYAYRACVRAKRMYATVTLKEFLDPRLGLGLATVTLKEFLDDGGDLDRDVYQRTGCPNIAFNTPENIAADPVWYNPNAPMSKFYDDARAWSTLSDANHRTGCCGSPTCVPLFQKKLKGVQPLPRCRVTAESCTVLTEWTKIVAPGAIDTRRQDPACDAVNIGSGAAALLSPPGNANVPGSRVPEYAVPYPGLLPRQLSPAAPDGYSCVPSSGTAPMFANNFVSEKAALTSSLLQSAWYASGCFDPSGMMQASNTAFSTLGQMFAYMRNTCLQAQLGDNDAEIRCCGRTGCNAVLMCPTIEPLTVPLPVCPGDTIAYRSGSGYGCRAASVVAGVQCSHVCALDSDASRCTDNVAVDINDVGCMLVDAQSCTQVKKWDDREVFPCAAGIDINGRACVGDANNATKTCQVHAQPTQANGVATNAQTVASACPEHVANPLHTPWAYHQQPGQCAASVFSAAVLIESFQASWALCEQQADDAGANEFSYDDVTGQCVVNTADEPCVTTLDVVEAVQEKSHYGSARADGSGTDLRAWIGLDGDLGATAAFARDVTAPQIDDFVCMPKQKCGTRDVHGRCIANVKNVFDNCGYVDNLFSTNPYPCATGCPFVYTTDIKELPVNRWGTRYNNFCECNQKNVDCKYRTPDGNVHNHEFTFEPVNPFLDDDRTRCALHTDRASCDADDACISRETSETTRWAVKPKIQGISSDDNCDYATGYPTNDMLTYCTPVAPKVPQPRYAIPELQAQQVDFHENYAQYQESVLGQDYASSFYRSWVSQPWNRDRFMAAAGRKSSQEDPERPFYASAIWSGSGGRDWDALMTYDKRWMTGAATVAFSGQSWHQGLDASGIDSSPVPAPAPADPIPTLLKMSSMKAYSDRVRFTPMWSPLRAWLLGAYDPFLDKTPQVANVKPRANKINDNFLQRIVAFRGRQPRQDRGAIWLEDVLVDRSNAVNQCLQSCDDDAHCKAVSLRSALLASDDEPLNFVNTGGGLGVQGDAYYRPQTCPSLYQPHVSAFQYNVMRWCPHVAERAIGLEKWFGGTSKVESMHHAFTTMFSGGLNVTSLQSGSFMTEESTDPDSLLVSDGVAAGYGYAPYYGQSYTYGMMASIGSECMTRATGPFALRGQGYSLGDAQCHIRLGLHHCNKCWKSQPNPGKLGTSSDTETTQTQSAPKIMCRKWRQAPLGSLGADTVVAKQDGDIPVDLSDIITAHDGDAGGVSRGMSKPINLAQHNDDVPAFASELGKARLQRPTPVRFRYTTIYLPKTAIDVDATKNTVSSSSTRYTRRQKAATHNVKRARKTTTPQSNNDVIKQDNTANTITTNVLQAAKEVLESLGVRPDNDDSFWVQRSTVCNNRQHQRPVFTSVRCPESLPMTCALPWPVYAQNIAANTANAADPTDYRIDGTKCVPMVAVCLQASWRYAGIQGQSLCAVAGRLLEVMLDKEPSTTPAANFQLGVPPHIDVGSFTWPVAWLGASDATTSNTSPFRTRRPEAPAGTVFASCAERKPCNQAPCPSGMGLAWTKAGVPFCTRVGSGSRGFQQATRDVPKSVHSARHNFGGFVTRAAAVSGTGPALYLNAANCTNNGCGGFITSHCDFSHVQDRQFPTCQAPSRLTQACCSSEVTLVHARMTQAEFNLLKAPKTLPHAVEPLLTCEAEHGIACANSEYAVRDVHNTKCSCASAECNANTLLPNVNTASMASLNSASVVVSQGNRCGHRVRWAPQYMSMGPGVTRCNGVDDITKGGGGLTSEAGQLCGCARDEAPDASWPEACNSPDGCAMHGVFEHVSGGGVACNADVTLQTPDGGGDLSRDVYQRTGCKEMSVSIADYPDWFTMDAPMSKFYDDAYAWCTATDATRRTTCCGSPTCVPTCVRFASPSEREMTLQAFLDNGNSLKNLFLSSVSNWCAHECLYRGSSCWGFDIVNDACVLHLDRDTCSGNSQYVRNKPLYKAHTSGAGKDDITAALAPAPAPTRDACADSCTATSACLAWAHDNGGVCHLANIVRKYVFTPAGLNINANGNDSFARLTQPRLDFLAYLQVHGPNATNASNFTISPVVEFNASAGGVVTNIIPVHTPCVRVLGVLDTNNAQQCAQACDFGELSHGCTGFTMHNDNTCTLCADGGGDFHAVSTAKHDEKLHFFTIAHGQSSVVYDSQLACTQACTTMPTCGHCIQVRSNAKQDQPRYVQVGTDQHVANMPFDNVYPWITTGYTKWDARCCVDAPCGQSHGASSFGMGVCPAPATDAHLAGPHAISVLDSNSMRCVTQCEPRFANAPACDTCAEDNFDVASNCTQCLPKFALASDGACSLCKDPRADITTQCRNCLPGFRVSPGGTCLEWTCTPELKFSPDFPSVTETTDVVLKLGTNERVATGSFVGTPEHQVPASLRSVVVRHASNLYLLGHNARYVVQDGAVSNDAVLDVVHESDWLDSLPIALDKPQPLTRTDLMNPDGVLGNFRCGASGFQASSDVSIQPCASSSASGLQILCTVDIAGAASKQKCADACTAKDECVSYIHQSHEAAVFAPSVQTISQVAASCQLYNSTQAANANRPRNVMVDRGSCAAAGVRVPTDGLVSYVRPPGMQVVKPVQSSMQFRVVRALDAVQQSAGCWIISRWHRHRVIEVEDSQATVAQQPCTDAYDVVTIAWLEHNVPLQGRDVVGTRLAGFMPRATTAYDLVGGSVLSEPVHTSSQCVQQCALNQSGFATRWDGNSLQCTCFHDDSVVRVSTYHVSHKNVVLTGRRPQQKAQDGQGPVPASCRIQGQGVLTMELTMTLQTFLENGGDLNRDVYQRTGCPNLAFVPDNPIAADPVWYNPNAPMSKFYDDAYEWCTLPDATHRNGCCGSPTCVPTCVHFSARSQLAMTLQTFLDSGGDLNRDVYQRTGCPNLAFVPENPMQADPVWYSPNAPMSKFYHDAYEWCTLTDADHRTPCCGSPTCVPTCIPFSSSAQLTMTLQTFLDNGGDLNEDVYRRTGCPNLAFVPQNPIAADPVWYNPNAPMSKFYDDAYAWCTLTDANHRTPCCGSPTCMPTCVQFTADGAVNSHAWLTMTLQAFLDNGGNLNQDVYQRTGCPNLAFVPANPIAEDPLWYSPDAPMSKFYNDAYAWCTLTDAGHRTPCCGSPTCVPTCTNLSSQDALCSAATEKDFDGFVLDATSTGKAQCRGLFCDTETSLFSVGSSADIVRLHKTNVTEPKHTQVLAFGDADIDTPLKITTQLNAAACCQQCNAEVIEANSYKFEQSTGKCTCYDARARVCAPELALDASNGACRFCTKLGEASNALCRLAPASACKGVLQAQNLPLCNNDQSYVTYSGSRVSQACDTQVARDVPVNPALGCDRSTGCVLTRRTGNFQQYFCSPADRTNMNTAEWHKPPQAIDVTDAGALPDPDAMCRAVGYGGGRCTSDEIAANNYRIATCDCALDRTGDAVSACPSTQCPPGSSTGAVTKLWCCEDETARLAPCGAAAANSAVVADVTTVFQPHDNSGSVVATVAHSNVCSASADFAQRFTLVRCAPQQCNEFGALVQNALFVASSEDNVLRRVPNDSCETCGLCRHPIVYRSALFIERAVLATGPSPVPNSSECPAHMPHRIASTQACALTTWGGGPTCCPRAHGAVCTGSASTAPDCTVLPVLSCADLDEACDYTRHVGVECKDLASVVLDDVESESICRQQCDVTSAPPCLLYEYVHAQKLCLLGKADNAGMRNCADPVSGAAKHRESNPSAVLAIKEQPPSQVCNSNSLRHYTQANHLAGSTNVVLSAVAREHSALYSLSALEKIKRLYGSFARQYRTFVPLAFEPPYDVLCGIAGGANADTHCPGTANAALGHASAHPLLTLAANAEEKLVFEPTVASLATNDNVAVIASAAVLTHATQAGSNACIEQAELSVQASADVGLVSNRHVDRRGLGWVDGVNAISLSNNRTQRACLQSCLEHVPTCNAFEHGSTNPLDLASCVLYVGQLPVPVSSDADAGFVVYIMNTQQTCTSPEQCVDVANFRSANALLNQKNTFEQALQRCRQETTASNGQPKLMGRASYINIIRCPPQAPRPTPWHVQFFDHGPGVMCWNELTSAPGVGANGHVTYPFTGQKPGEPDDAPDSVIEDPVINFTAPIDLLTQVSSRVHTFDGCDFVLSKNATAVMQDTSATTNSRAFVDLRNVTECDAQSQADCGTDDVCRFDNQTQKCVYECTDVRCANTLLCRGLVFDRQTNTRTCLFLPVGTGPGHMQSPSALQPCSVVDVHTVVETPHSSAEIYIKKDCCVKLSSADV